MLSVSVRVPSVADCCPVATFSEETDPRPLSDNVSEPTRLLNITDKFVASTSFELSKSLLVVNVTERGVTANEPPLRL